MHPQKTTSGSAAQAKRGTGYFTASELALVLNVTRTRAHQIMSGAGASRTVREVRGVQAHCWPVESLPPRVAGEVDELVRRKAYCNRAHLFAAPPAPWQPPHPLNTLAPAAVVKAHTRCAVLSPILAAKDAQIVRVSELVRRASVKFAEVEKSGDSLGERAIHRWIEEAIDRDKG